MLEYIPGHTEAEIRQAFDERFGIVLTEANIGNFKYKYKIKSGTHGGQFQKGQEAHNKGQKVSKEVYEKMAPTMFKAGNIPNNYRPIGSERIDCDGYVMVKVADPKSWRLKQRVLYEQYHGVKLEKSDVVLFLDGDKQNFSKDNLVKLTRAELARLNQDVKLRDNPEMNLTAVMIAKLKCKMGETRMKKTEENGTSFCSYFLDWMNTYKKGAVREVTFKKYQMAYKNLYAIIGDMKIGDIDRKAYQMIINEYAETHEKATCYDFHHIIKSCIMDAVDEGLIERDPTRKVVIKGKSPAQKKLKFLSEYELKKLLEDLTLGPEPSWDWLIFLIAKTGLRFSEALAVTPNDFDFEKLTLNIDKTWNYKNGGGFDKTKNRSSVRKVTLDWMVATKFSVLIKNLEDKEAPIFVNINPVVYNSTVNGILERHCKNQGIPVITIHGLRHTHASVLLANGVSTPSVSKRLGHSSISTTQKVYIHIIQELENQDTQLILTTMSGI